MLHTNIRSLKSNLEKFQTHLLEELDLHFNVIEISKTIMRNELGDLDLNINPMILNYNFDYVPTPLSAGGVGMYIDQRFKYTVIEKSL